MNRETQYYKRLSRTLLIAFFCLSVVPIAATAFIMKKTVERTNIVNLQELAEITVRNHQEIISRFLDEKLHLLRVLVALHPPEFFSDQTNIEELFKTIGPKQDFVDLQVIDASGEQYAYVGPYREIVKHKSYASAHWFQETLLNGVHVSDVFKGYRDTPHFVVAVTDPLKSFVIRATINSSYFNALLHSAQLGPNGDIFIVNRNGEFQTPSLLDTTSIEPLIRNLAPVNGSSSVTVTATGIYATKWIDNGQWILVLKANISDYLMHYLQLRDKVIWIVLIIALLAMVAAAVISKLLSNHLEKTDKESATLLMQVHQMEKMATVGRLAAGIAHEINNPLQLITNQATWLKELLQDENRQQIRHYDEYTNTVEQINNNVKRAGTITHRLLGFSRKLTSRHQRVQVNELLKETLSFIEREAEYNNIKIVCVFDHDLPTTSCEGQLLQQVFLNLINNGIDAIGQNGQIRISTRTSGDDNIRIEISDSGTGIDAEHLKKLFDPFFTTKEPGKGTGLGLYISYEIIRKLGGELTAQNSPNGGAVFSVTLPLESKD